MIFINESDTSKYLPIFMISIFFYMFSAPSCILFWIAASVADATALNTYGIKVLTANVLSAFFVNVKPVFNNCPRRLPRISPDCIF